MPVPNDQRRVIRGDILLHRIYMESPFGIICIEDDGEALTALYLDDQNEKSGEMRRKAESVNKEADDEERKTENEDSELLLRAVTELQEYFAGERTSFDLPLHPQGTEFQKLVWNALREIPYGETRSYGEIAQAIGRPKACRAVGGANNKNPVMLFIPCHRVIGSNGGLTGFAGGLDMKRRLLEMEAANRPIFREDEKSGCGITS